MTLVQNIRTFIKSHSIQGTKATWGLFVLFALILFLKNVLFHWFAFHSILVSSLWKQPLAFFLFYLSKGAIAIFISSFVFITKRKWWVIVVSLILDIWIIANLVYYGANDFFIDFNTMFVANNLSGFGDSIFTFFSWNYLIYPMLTLLLWGFLLCIPRKRNRQSKAFLVLMLIYLICHIISCFPIWKKEYYDNIGNHEFDRQAGRSVQENGRMGGVKCFVPFFTTKELFTLNHHTPLEIFLNGKSFSSWSRNYIRNESIIQYFPAMLVYNYYYQQQISTDEQNIDEILLNDINFQFEQGEVHPENLILILVESFESWVLVQDSICGEAIMPNLKAFMRENPLVYCDSIISQVKAGVSGDGQLIIHTGLLPVHQGVVTHLYSGRTFPSFVHNYPNSSTITSTLSWSQDTMSIRYGYKNLDLVHYENDFTMDVHLFDGLDSVVKNIQEPFAIQAITVDSHSPFHRHNSPSSFPQDMPAYLRDYLRCLNHTDSCMQSFFEAFKNSSKLQNTTIVITGDHTVFKSKMLQSFLPYAQQHNIPINGEQSYCPLIIYSPKIKENIHIDELCYQMDIYPTILNLVGCEGYYWKGFGVNLLDSAARNNRPFTPEQAYEISDKLIRADYFRELQ